MRGEHRVDSLQLLLSTLPDAGFELRRGPLSVNLQTLFDPEFANALCRFSPGCPAPIRQSDAAL
jgi:hypothetical protein